jgi:hypothetical protein
MKIEATEFLPLARREALITKEVDGELLVYDVTRDKAHCLNETAAAIWRLCDGRTNVGEISERLVVSRQTAGADGSGEKAEASRQTADGSRQMADGSSLSTQHSVLSTSKQKAEASRQTADGSSLSTQHSVLSTSKQKAEASRQMADGSSLSTQHSVLSTSKQLTPNTQHPTPFAPDTRIVWLALDQLRRSHLLEEATAENEKTFWPAAIPGLANMSRREAVRRIGLGAAIALPIVISMTAPTAVEAAVSCGHHCATCSSPIDCCGTCSTSVSGCSGSPRCT